MLQKLILLIVLAIFLVGCAASDASDPLLDQNRPIVALSAKAEPAEVIQDVGTGIDMYAEADAVMDSEAEYFLFSSSSNTVVDGDDMTILYENQCIPTFSSPDRSREVWVTELLDRIARNYQVDSRNLYDYAMEFIDLNGTDCFYSYSNYQQLGIARHDETVVSLISLSSLYAGGTHPNSVQTAYNLDVANQKILRLEDVIEEDAAPALAQRVVAGIERKFAPIDGGTGLFEDYGVTIEKSMNYGNMTPYWYLNDAGLVIFYNQYELGPYAAGIIRVELPYESLEGILREAFFPAPADGTDGDLILLDESADCNAIPITVEPQGQPLLVGVEGRVHQVQLSEILWLEDTPIAQNMIFSALKLEEHDVLKIIGDTPSPDSSLAIEFVNGLDEHTVYYIHDGVLSTKP